MLGSIRNVRMPSSKKNKHKKSATESVAEHKTTDRLARKFDRPAATRVRKLLETTPYDDVLIDEWAETTCDVAMHFLFDFERALARVGAKFSDDQTGRIFKHHSQERERQTEIDTAERVLVCSDVFCDDTSTLEKLKLHLTSTSCLVPPTRVAAQHLSQEEVLGICVGCGEVCKRIVVCDCSCLSGCTRKCLISGANRFKHSCEVRLATASAIALKLETQLPSSPFVLTIDPEKRTAFGIVDMVTAIRYAPELPSELITVLSDMESRFLSNHPSLIIKQIDRLVFGKSECRPKMNVIIA